MLTGLASPSHPTLMHFWAEGVRAGLKEPREGIPTGDAKAEVPEVEKIRGEARTGQRSR